MRLTFEALLIIFALFSAYYIVNLNEQYADMVAATGSVQWCRIEFGSSSADKPCTVIGDELAEVSMK
jgi:hypothetical protein